MQEYQRYTIPSSRGVFFHVFGKNPDTGKVAYLGPYNTDDEARQNAVAAFGIEGDFTVHRSIHRDSSVAKQEYRHLKFKESGKLWETLKPIRNIRKGDNENGVHKS